MFRPTQIEHPIKMYIRRDLGITVEQFGQIAGIPQSTLATWIKRERRVEKLPIDFYAALATVADKKIEIVYKELLQWQQQADRYKQESLQTLSGEQPLFALAQKEGQKIYRKYKAEGRQADLLEPMRQLQKAIKKLDSELFIQTLIAVYGNISEPMPPWFAGSFQKKDQLKEVGQAFYNEILIKG
ncbi:MULTISPECIES: hypothetical protein [Enterococcus]|uniref:hypothetical protein n=1 Tax=Enterococcus sp. AZ103 TaxID=2774628 RepID=UPI003F2550D5